MYRRLPRRFTSLLTALSLALTLLAPSAALGAPADVDVTVDPVPQNLGATQPEGFVTGGELVAFDVTVTNGSGSTVTNVNITGGPSPIGTIVNLHLVAGSPVCTRDAASFSCALGNMAGNAPPVTVRVVVSTLTVTVDASPVILSFGVSGNANGSTGSDGPMQSRGDTFDDLATVEVVARFSNSETLRGIGAYIEPDSARRTYFSDTDLGSGNPLVTLVSAPPFPAAAAPFGTSIWFTERDSAPGLCPAATACVGQALELHLFSNQTLPEPARVELRFDELKQTIKALNKWQLWHFDNTGGNPVALFANPCTFGATGLPTNAPCGESRSADPADRDDWIAVVWLPKNGYIKGGY